MTKPFVPTVLLARVQTQLDLSLSRRREQQTNRCLKDILDSMNEGMVVLDSSNIIQKVNPKLEQLTEKTSLEMVGQPFHSLFIDNDVKEEPEFDGRLLCSNGEQIAVHVLSASLNSSEGGKSRVLLIHDLRALLSSESEKRVSHAKDKFLASMSHELSSPLASAIGISEQLIDHLDGKEEQMAYQIKAVMREQQARIQDVLEVSRIEDGCVMIKEEAFNLSELVADLQSIYSPQAEQSGLVLQVVERDLPIFQIMGDADYLQQILHNLLNNAVKFTERGAISLTVWCSESSLHFKVLDSGVGIKPELMERLFERFLQGDDSPSKGFSGSGLGLYIANSLAVLMGGSIHVESQEGKGTVFQLDLPCKLSNQPLTPITEEGVATLSRFKGRVLIAEDAPEMWMLIENMLQAMGIETAVAKNGQEAIEMALASPFDLILMDMQMPIMGGVEATVSLRQVGYSKPISALSAKILPEDRLRLEEVGCNAYLDKPVDKRALLQVLQSFLQADTEGDKVEDDANEAMVSDELRQTFMGRLSSMGATLETALRYEQWDEVRSIAHNIKGSGSSFGYPRLTELGQAVCEAIDYEYLERVTDEGGRLVSEINSVLSE